MNQRITVPRANTAVLCVDMQNGMCDPRGSHVRLGLDISRLTAAIEPCRLLMDAARAAGLPVIYSRLVYAKDFSNVGTRGTEVMQRLKDARVCPEGSWDAEIVPALAPAPGELVIEKTRMSSFIRTPLVKELRARCIESLVICGVTTNMCIESTARDAAQLDFRTFVVEDAVGEVDPARHAAALTALRWGFAHIVSLGDVIGDWR